MKRIILIACFITLAAGIAQAQPHRGGGNPAQMLTEKLGLDENQAAEVTLIIEETRALHQGEREKSKETFCAIKADSEVRIMGVLNDEQQLTFARMKAERATRMASRGTNSGEHRKGPGNGNKGHQQGGGQGGGKNRSHSGPPDCSN